MKEAAPAEVSGGTIMRVETEADGNGGTRRGTPVTVYVDASFDVVESR